MAPVPALVITRDRHAGLQIERALRAMGMRVQQRKTVADAAVVCAVQRPQLLVIDCDDLLYDEVGPFLTAVAGTPVVLVARSPQPPPLLGLMELHGLFNLVAKHEILGGTYPMIDETELMVTCHKLLHRQPFGLVKYLSGCAVVLHEVMVATVAGKARFLADFEAMVTELRVPTSVIGDIVTVADELVLNALIHAPRDADGVPKYEDKPRATLRMTDAERVPVQYGCDGKQLMLSVTDPFGALERATIARYILPALRQDPLAVETKPGGGGLGLGFTVRRCHQLVFNVEPGVRTEVIAGWYVRGPSAREFRKVGKSVNVFWT